MTTPRVSVIVASTGESPHLAEVLARAREQAEAVGGELLLSWNGPGSPEPWRSRVHRVISEPRPGKSLALNAAAAAARAEVCAFLDDDGLPEPGWLATLLASFEREGERLGGVGGRVLPREEESPDWYRRLVEGRASHFLGPRHDLGNEARDYAAESLGVLPLGANCAYRRHLLARFPFASELGPNRVTRTRGGEDTLFARQVLESGHRLRYEPHAVVIHPVARERMTQEFVLQAFFWQGVEKVRIQRALGRRARRLAAIRTRLRLLPYVLLGPLARALPLAARVRYRCRAERHRGVLRELTQAGLMLLIFVLGFFGASCGRAEGRERLNVLLVVIDTLRADHLGCYGYARDTSPALDRLATESVLFRSAFAPAPRTVASHASLFTSTYPWVHGAWNEPGPGEEGAGFRALAPSAVCLAEVLAAAGYDTAAFADGGWLQVDRGLAQGFQRFESRLRGARDRVDAALGWLEERPREQPFFLFVHTYEVHTPYLPPEELLADLEPDYKGPLRAALRGAREAASQEGQRPSLVEVHRRFFEPLLPALDEADRRFLVALYDAEIRSADRELARLFDRLRERGELERTLVVVTSDHGEEFGEHGRFEHTQVYEECLRVPLIVRVPGRTRGVVRNDPVELVDVMPTVLAKLSIRIPDAAQGRALTLDSGAGVGTPMSWAETNEPEPQVAWRDGRRKVVLFPRDEARAEVFDLSQDPREEHALPLTGDTARLLENVRRELARLRATAGERRQRFGLEPVERSPLPFREDQTAELRALGYL